MSLTSGTRLGPYEILAPLGAGGMGEVYRARDTRLGRDVAIKILSPTLGADLSAHARFAREARAVAALSHPNILAIHDIGSEAGVAFVVMELLDGQTLRDIFSFRAVLYEMVTGTRAFKGDSAIDTLHRIVHTEPAPLDGTSTDAPTELRWILAKCLAKDPDERYQFTHDRGRPA